MRNWPFLFQTAYRDSRKNRGKLFLFMSSIVVGIAALVAINSFNYNLIKDIDREAAALLGADLVVEGNRPMGAVSTEITDSLAGDRATEIEMLSMGYFPGKGTSQFVRIKAVEGAFPFYGVLETVPEHAAKMYQDLPSAILDESLMIEQDLKVGDSIRLGDQTFDIIGVLKKTLGNSGLSSSFAPLVYIGKQYIQSTGLIQPGSLVNYSYFFRLDSDFPVDEWKEKRADTFRKESMRLETISDRKENVSEAFAGLYNFLNLVALVALLLGCIGVASSVFIYIKSKISSIAIFRCLGLRRWDAFYIYFIQIGILGSLSVVLGVLIGSIIQVALPAVLSDFLPFEVAFKISWKAILEGFIIGVVMTLLFALLPLLSAKNISPMRTLRMVGSPSIRWKNRGSILVFMGVTISVIGFLLRMTKDWKLSVAFGFGLVSAFIILYLLSQLIIYLVKKFFPRGLGFEFRQGISNLFRPNNQTTILMVSIGLGTAVLTTLFIVQGLLLRNVEKMDAGSQPNMFMFGIEAGQKDSVTALVESRGMPVIQQMPIVTMRLEGWKGRTKSEWLDDSSRVAKGWAIHRESRVTYRDYLDDNEKLISGDFAKTADGVKDSIFISLATSYAEAMDVDLGDEMVFNVQGALMKTYVGSIRKIDNANMRARFLILFPPGVLEKAPQFHILVTKSPSPENTAQLRNLVVKSFPNVSVIDLGMVLETVQEILNKVAYIIQFMAVFCILTGFIVLLSSLMLSKYQRIKESVLLRTLGASRRQINRINFVEYFSLGSLAAITGIIIAILASFGIARFQMDLDFSLNWMSVVVMFFSVVFFTILIGFLNSREVVNNPPLEILRKEVG